MRNWFTTISLAGLPVCAASSIFAQDNQLSVDLPNARPRFIRVTPHGHRDITAATASTGFDSLVHFNGRDYASGVDPNGKPQTTWYYTSTALFGAYSYPNPEVITETSPAGKGQLQAMTFARMDEGHPILRGALSSIYKKVKNDLAAESRPSPLPQQKSSRPRSAKMCVQTTE
jgi:hypothetical protein